MKVACFTFATSLIFMAACQSSGSTNDAGGTGGTAGTPGTGGRGGSAAAGGQSVQAGAGGTAGAAGIAGMAGMAGAAGTTGAAGHGGASGAGGGGGRGGSGGANPCGTQSWCPDCDGVGHCFVGGACPALSCPAPDAGTTIACSALTTLAECDARGDCHSVFMDPHKCGCPTIGCCATFARCVAGGRATCTGAPSCEAATPYCEGPYVVSYTAFCYEGCVRATACAP